MYTQSSLSIQISIFNGVLSFVEFVFWLRLRNNLKHSALYLLPNTQLILQVLYIIAAHIIYHTLLFAVDWLSLFFLLTLIFIYIYNY